MRHAQLQLCAFDGLPEANVHLILEIAARFLLRYGLVAPATKHIGEDVAEPASRCRTSASRALGDVAKIESAKIKRNFLPLSATACGRFPVGRAESPRAKSAAAGIRLCGCRINVVRVEPDLVVNLPLLGIAQHIVGLRDRFELLLRGLVPWIHVGVILARQLAKRLADLL